MLFSNHDISRLRALSAEQYEIANSNKMQSILKDWQRHSSFSSDSRPMVSIELATFEDEVISPLLECTDEQARSLETKLLSNIVNHTLFDDDTIVNPYMEFSYKASFVPFSLPARIEHSNSDINSLGHHFVEQITDLEQDFDKIKPSTWTLTSKSETERQIEEYNELLGDLLPAKLVPPPLTACLTQDIVHLMSMENMYFAMYDYPELFLKMMDSLADDYISYFRDIENDNRLSATTTTQRVCQGSYSFTDRLPSNLNHYTAHDVWGYMDSQETSGLSPEMFHEFIYPSYRKVMDCFGRLSYGCCEAVEPIWESCLSTLPNLGKVSISPWCNESFMGERLAGKSITYLRKPSPNLVGLTRVLDEAAVRAHIAKTVQAAKGCQLEIVQRDVYRIYAGPEKIHRYVQIIRRECEKHQRV